MMSLGCIVDVSGVHGGCPGVHGECPEMKQSAYLKCSSLLSSFKMLMNLLVVAYDSMTIHECWEL